MNWIGFRHWMWLALTLLLGIGSICLADDASPADNSEASSSSPLVPGFHTRRLVVDELNRSAIVYVPPQYKSDKPTALVLALHGAAMNGLAMIPFCGMNKKSNESGFIVVYPDATSPGPVLTWNAGGFQEGIGSQADDVKFLRQLIDDVCRVANIDQKRIYACGLSNGGMMCYRLAAEMSDRIAAIAPVAGSMPNANVKPKRPVSVIHFHGTTDPLVPFVIEKTNSRFWLKLKSVDDSIAAWCKIDGCDPKKPHVDQLTKETSELPVTRYRYGPGKHGSEVVLVKVEGGGHTWPGMVPPIPFLGKSALDILANDLIWEFFEKHPLE